MLDPKLREALMDKLDVVVEFNELLGAHRGNVRSCWNKSFHSNEDASPSLSFSVKTTAWRCHACGEKGDIFTLYSKVKGWTFAATLKHLLVRYGLWDGASEDVQASREKIAYLEDDYLRTITKAHEVVYKENHAWHGMVLGALLSRYGISQDTAARYRLGWYMGRLLIPIHASSPESKKYVNIRQHDILRKCCHWKHKETGNVVAARPAEVTDLDILQQHYPVWEPSYSGTAGKTLSAKSGDGDKSWLFPMEVVKSPSFYFVGGELKALLLNQVGVPAVCFTAGEGHTDSRFARFFAGKHIRVLMDPDPAGEKAADTVSRWLASCGAYVEIGVWPDIIKHQLPAKGDVTDLLIKCGHNPECLQYLQWRDVLYAPDPVQEDVSLKEPLFDDMTQTSFGTLTDPRTIQTWMRIPALVSGRGDAPYAVPHQLKVVCPQGRDKPTPICAGCRLATHGFQGDHVYDLEEQVSMVGCSQAEVNKKNKHTLGIPASCMKPEIKVEMSAVESVILTPTIEEVAEEFEYRHHQAYLVVDKKESVKENVNYEFGGLSLADPKTSKFTFAVRGFKPLKGDVFDFRPHPDLTRDLQRCLDPAEPLIAIAKLTADIRDNVACIYGQDRMIQTILLSMFLPFTFSLGQESCERICPAVMVLGDTTTGKSTVTRRMLKHFGAGRFAAAEAGATFAGLVGGNLQNGAQRQSFSWGLIPTSHRGFVALDEYNKLDLKDIGAMTSLMSSGVAERRTANGQRTTMSWVRMLYLCNPRAPRVGSYSPSLASFDDPTEAALNVCGSPQDLGRIEYLHIQQTPKRTIFDDLMERNSTRVSQTYTSELARYHLKWAWSLNKDSIHFTDPKYVHERSKQLADAYGQHVLMLPAMARFKLARFAAGFAAATFSMNKSGECIVDNSHVAAAAAWMDAGYKDIIKGCTTGGMPADLRKLLDQIHKYKKLMTFVRGEKWSSDDIFDIFGRQYQEQFMDLAQLEYGFLTRRGVYFYAKTDHFRNLMEAYINERTMKVIR